jgi:hypothetical protein
MLFASGFHTSFDCRGVAFACGKFFVQEDRDGGKKNKKELKYGKHFDEIVT